MSDNWGFTYEDKGHGIVFELQFLWGAKELDTTDKSSDRNQRDEPVPDPRFHMVRQHLGLTVCGRPQVRMRQVRLPQDWWG